MKKLIINMDNLNRTELMEIIIAKQKMIEALMSDLNDRDYLIERIKELEAK